MYHPEAMLLPKSYLAEHPFDNGMLRVRDENLAAFPRDKAEIRKHIADYYATISHTDAQIGRILTALKKSEKYENTIIVFCSDNGLALGSHGLMGKQNIYDHSVRVPLIIAGPGIPKGQRRKQLCYLYDIYPTLCDLAKLQIPKTVQYKSLNEVIFNKDSSHRNHIYGAFMQWQRSIRDHQYKLIEYCVGDERQTQLFDLLTDPEEINNLAGLEIYQEKITTLRSMLKKERVILNDGNVPYSFTNNQGVNFWNAYDKN
jgi:arylsulfatase A-like enzyme